MKYVFDAITCKHMTHLFMRCAKIYLKIQLCNRADHLLDISNIVLINILNEITQPWKADVIE